MRRFKIHDFAKSHFSTFEAPSRPSINSIEEGGTPGFVSWFTDEESKVIAFIVVGAVAVLLIAAFSAGAILWIRRRKLRKRAPRPLKYPQISGPSRTGFDAF